MTKKRLFTYLPTLPKRLCLVFSNLCNILMLIAVQSSAPFSSKRGSPSYFMRRFCTTSDTCRHKIGNTSGGERKVCTLNAKGTAGRRRPKRSRQKPSAIALRIRRHRRFARARVQQRERSVRRRSSCRVLKL